MPIITIQKMDKEKKGQKDSNRHFSKDTQVASNHMKRYTHHPAIIREMQIKVTIRYYTTLIMMATIKIFFFKENKYTLRM